MVSLKLVFARTLNAQFKHVVDMVLTNVLVMYGCVWGMFDSRRGSKLHQVPPSTALWVFKNTLILCPRLRPLMPSVPLF